MFFLYVVAEDGLNVGLIVGLTAAAVVMLTVAITLLVVFRHDLDGWTKPEEDD